jgi:hypothetical protein
LILQLLTMLFLLRRLNSSSHTSLSSLSLLLLLEASIKPLLQHQAFAPFFFLFFLSVLFYSLTDAFFRFNIFLMDTFCPYSQFLSFFFSLFKFYLKMSLIYFKEINLYSCMRKIFLV